LGLIAFANAQVTVQGTIGVPVNIVANTLSKVSFGGGVLPSVDILVSADTTVQLGLLLPLNLNALFGSLPTGYSSLTLGTAVGYTVQFGSENVIVSANLTTGALDSVAQQLINLFGRAGALSFSSVSNAFQDIPVISSSITNGITIPIHQTASYVLAAVKSNAAAPNIYGRIKKLVANTKSLVAFATNFTTDFIIEVSSNVDADLNVVFSAVKPVLNSPPANWIPIGAYWDITAAGATVNAVLNYTYSTAKLAAAGVSDPKTLRFAFYDTVKGAWELVDGNVVDTVKNVISQTTSHFSQWGVYSAGTNANDAQGIIASIFLLAVCLVALL